jgi:hypothetical protein
MSTRRRSAGRWTRPQEDTSTLGRAAYARYATAAKGMTVLDVRGFEWRRFKLTIGNLLAQIGLILWPQAPFVIPICGVHHTHVARAAVKSASSNRVDTSTFSLQNGHKARSNGMIGAPAGQYHTMGLPRSSRALHNTHWGGVRSFGLRHCQTSARTRPRGTRYTRFGFYRLDWGWLWLNPYRCRSR